MLRLKALLPLWLPWAKFVLADTIERKLHHIYSLAHRGPLRAARRPRPHLRFEIRRLPTQTRHVAAGAR